MEIIDKDGNKRLRFFDFKKKYNSQPIFINVSVEIFVKETIGKESIEVELSDIEEIKENGQKLYDSLISTFYFQPIEGQIQLKFEKLQTGNISISGFLRDKLNTYTLNFSFEISPFELLEIVRQAGNITDVLN